MFQFNVNLKPFCDQHRIPVVAANALCNAALLFYQLCCGTHEIVNFPFFSLHPSGFEHGLGEKTTEIRTIHACHRNAVCVSCKKNEHQHRELIAYRSNVMLVNAQLQSEYRENHLLDHKYIYNNCCYTIAWAVACAQTFCSKFFD